MEHLYEMPLPYPTGVLHLPEGAGEVQVRITKVWKPDIFDNHFVVEFPAWEGWARKVADTEARGITPTTLTMWAPREAVLMNEVEIERIKEAVVAAM
ncbi:hypothetical protein OH540_09485 [Streptomyces sp. BPPL-273]|uniref:hypothetical protein n=1 Tax=unclassified Streptomyces TaxID=2593676 RepID=UPI0024AF73E3|nr:hypothetical protein [Streptomyces sp. BPPL-273]WHM30254.1 hypothetical protein OH540_09485 [Streptomyces sp. BPPL-273]